jgi:hypothetical protein
MEVSPEKTKSVSANGGQRQPYISKILYRAAGLVAALAIVSVFATFSQAQEEIPQITVGERKAEKKKDTGPRAIAVVQLRDNGKASLVPVAILINGKFWDATAYKADPIPMALEPGTVYEAERTGNSVGLFTVSTALHSNAVNSTTPWLGTGNWLPGAPDIVAHAPAKVENVPVGIDTGDQPPRLTKNPDASNPAPAATQPPSSTKSSPQPPPQSSDPDAPPRLKKPDSSISDSSQTAQNQTPQNQTAPASTPSAPNSTAPTTGSKPADAKSDAKSADAKPSEPPGPASDSGAGESGHPRLRRGKAVAEPADEEIPGYSKVGSAPAKSSPRVATAADQDHLQFIPAVSDASGPQPRAFTFEWLKDEEPEKRQQMVILAKEQLRVYLDARAKARTAASAKPAAQGSHHAAARPAKFDPILENTQMVTYDLWNSNQPIIVFSTEAHLPPPPAGTPHSETDAELHYSVMLVAYPDIYNNLHKLYVGVTDRFHLDLTPRLDLIDAVDADGDGRGELLFKETSDAGPGWILFRANGDKLWKMFDSLKPE